MLLAPVRMSAETRYRLEGRTRFVHLQGRDKISSSSGEQGQESSPSENLSETAFSERRRGRRQGRGGLSQGAARPRKPSLAELNHETMRLGLRTCKRAGTTCDAEGTSIKALIHPMYLSQHQIVNRVIFHS